MAYIRTAVDPDALRQACQIADATEIVVYDAEFPHQEGQQFVHAIVHDARGGEHPFDLTHLDWRDLRYSIEQEAEVHGDTVKFVLDLGEPETMHLKLKIENVYSDGTVTNEVEVDVPKTEFAEHEDDFEDWAYAWIYPHTGTGRTEGDAGYFVEVIEASDPSWVGREFEWGI